MKKKEQVERVTLALIGFRPGQRVRVVRESDSWLKGAEGEIVTLESRIPDLRNHPKNRWLLEGKRWWLAECSMELL